MCPKVGVTEKFPCGFSSETFAYRCLCGWFQWPQASVAVTHELFRRRSHRESLLDGACHSRTCLPKEFPGRCARSHCLLFRESRHSLEVIGAATACPTGRRSWCYGHPRDRGDQCPRLSEGTAEVHRNTDANRVDVHRRACGRVGATSNGVPIIIFCSKLREWTS